MQGVPELERITKALSRLDTHLRFINEAHVRGKQKEAQVEKVPLYRPWSQEDYMARVQSFHWSWADRLDSGGVLTCARYGWYQRRGDHGGEDEVNTINCAGCDAELYLPWDDDLPAETKHIVSEEYLEKIIDTGHGLQGTCPWRIRPCPKDITLARFLDAGSEWQAYLKRCETFPDISLGAFHIGEAELQSLVEVIQQKVQVSQAEIPITVSLLAALFWRFSADENCVECDFGCAKLPASTLHHEFHPVSGHSWFCPLLAGSPPAWQTLKDCLQQKGAAGDRMPSLRVLLSAFTARQLEDILNQPAPSNA